MGGIMPDFGDVEGGSSSLPLSDPPPRTAMVKADLPDSVKRNLERLLKSGATADDIREYMTSMGFVNRSESRPLSPSLPKPFVEQNVQGGDKLTPEAQPVDRKKQNAENWAGFSANALQALTLGSADNLLGLVASPETVENYRRTIENYAIANPKQTVAAHVMGSLPYMLIPGGQGLLTQMGIGAGLGMAGGALSADDKVGPANRGTGAVVGGLIGGLAPPVIRLSGAILGPLTRAAARAMRISNPAKQADLLIAREIQRGGGFDKAIENVDRAIANGSPTTLAEAGGSNARGLAEHLMNAPGSGGEDLVTAIGSRQSEQPMRLMEMVTKAMGQKASDAHELAKNIVATRKLQSAPHYDKAFAGPPLVPTRALDRLMRKSPLIERAWEIGRGIAKSDPANRYQISQLFIKDPANPARRIINPKLQIKGFDYMKKGLDKMLQGRDVDGTPSIDKEVAANLRELKNAILEKVDDWSPDYAAARRINVEGYEAQEALEAGMEALKRNTPPGMIRDQLKGRFTHPGQQELYRSGVLQHIFDEMGKGGTAGSDFTKGLLQGKNSLRRRQLEAVFESLPNGQKALQDLIDAVEVLELPMSRTAGRAFNSRTAARQFKAADIEGDESLLQKIATRPSAMGKLAATGSHLAGQLKSGWSEDVRNYAAQKYQLTGPELKEYLEWLRDYSARHPDIMDKLGRGAERAAAVQGAPAAGRVLQASGGTVLTGN